MATPGALAIAKQLLDAVGYISTAQAFLSDSMPKILMEMANVDLEAAAEFLRNDKPERAVILLVRAFKGSESAVSTNKQKFWLFRTAQSEVCLKTYEIATATSACYSALREYDNAEAYGRKALKYLDLYEQEAIRELPPTDEIGTTLSGTPIRRIGDWQVRQVQEDVQVERDRLSEALSAISSLR